MPFMAALALFTTGTGCTAPSAKAPDAAKTAASDDWVTLPPATGSNVPRRVRRSELQGELNASNVGVISGKTLTDQVRPNGPPPGAKSN